MPQFRSEQVSLFRDGILFSTNDLKKDGAWSHYYKRADFTDIDYVQVSPNQFTIKLKSGQTLYEYINLAKGDIEQFRDKWLTYQKVGDIPFNIPLSSDDETGAKSLHSSGKPKKSLGRIALEWGVLLIAFFVVTTVLRDGEPTLCEGRARYVAEQMPQVMDILSGRYPLQVGLLRSLLNKDGSADIVAQQFVKTALSGSNDGPFACAKDSIVLRINPSGLRTRMTEEIERQLNLN